MVPPKSYITFIVRLACQVFILTYTVPEFISQNEKLVTSTLIILFLTSVFFNKLTYFSLLIFK